MQLRTGFRIFAVLMSSAVLSCGGDSIKPESLVAKSFTVLSGGGQTSLPGAWLPEPIVVRVLDQNGQPLASATVTVVLSGEGETERDRPTTGSDGQVAIRWRLGANIGQQSLEVLVTGIQRSSLVTAEAVMEGIDMVRVADVPGGTYGWLSSGSTAFGGLLDYPTTSSATEAPTGDFRSPTGSVRSEITFFSRNASPQLILDPWTDAPDVVQMSFQEPVVVPVTVWIMKAPFATTLARARSELEHTKGLYANEALGITFEVEEIDATATADIEELMAFDCSKVPATELTVGHRDNRLNLYYVETVDGGSDRGHACPIGGNFVAMAGSAGIELLSHEIGHMLGLLHIDTAEGFGPTNIMHSASNSRRYLTEGQVFRAHWSVRSALNQTLGMYAGGLLRNCLGQFTESACPSISTRLFADGGAVALAASPSDPIPLSRLDRALLRRCNTGDPPELETGFDPAELVQVFRTGPSPELRSFVNTSGGEPAARIDGIRAEALRLLVLNDDGRASRTLDEALAEDPVTFAGVVGWGRDRLTRN